MGEIQGTGIGVIKGLSQGDKT